MGINHQLSELVPVGSGTQHVVVLVADECGLKLIVSPRYLRHEAYREQQ